MARYTITNSLNQLRSGVVFAAVVASVTAISCGGKSGDLATGDGGESGNLATGGNPATGDGGESGNLATGGESSSFDTVSASLLIPEGFAGNAVMVGLSFFETGSPFDEGKPAGVGERFEDPAIVPGERHLVHSSQVGLDGDYYVTAVVYCEGGGDGMGPVPGVDWIGISSQPLTLGPGTGTVDAGEISMVLHW